MIIAPPRRIDQPHLQPPDTPPKMQFIRQVILSLSPLCMRTLQISFGLLLCDIVGVVGR